MKSEFVHVNVPLTDALPFGSTVPVESMVALTVGGGGPSSSERTRFPPFFLVSENAMIRYVCPALASTAI